MTGIRGGLSESASLREAPARSLGRYSREGAMTTGETSAGVWNFWVSGPWIDEHEKSVGPPVARTGAQTGLVRELSMHALMGPASSCDAAAAAAA